MMVDKVTLEMLKDKDILHIGVVGDWKRYIKGDNIQDWDFPIIDKIGKSVLGIDIEKKGIKVLRKKGFRNIVYGDAENFNLNKKFDVIYAGDLIEHLNNIGKFMACCKKHMRRDSVLLIATPNPFSINLIFWALFGDITKRLHFDHTVLLQEKNLGILAKRYGLNVRKTRYYTIIDRRNILYMLFGTMIMAFGKIKKSLHQSFVVEITL
jgi:2-polyprenyl-3-methyl-5-hydroxy-6-metoxy-1,4-benzoquinol methylase